MPQISIFICHGLWQERMLPEIAGEMPADGEQDVLPLRKPRGRHNDVHRLTVQKGIRRPLFTRPTTGSNRSWVGCLATPESLTRGSRESRYAASLAETGGGERCDLSVRALYRSGWGLGRRWGAGGRLRRRSRRTAAGDVVRDEASLTRRAGDGRRGRPSRTRPR